MNMYKVIGKYFDYNDKVYFEFNEGHIIIDFNNFDELEEWVQLSDYKFFDVDNLIIKDYIL